MLLVLPSAASDGGCRVCRADVLEKSLNRAPGERKRSIRYGYMLLG